MCHLHVAAVKFVYKPIYRAASDYRFSVVLERLWGAQESLDYVALTNRQASDHVKATWNLGIAATQGHACARG